MEQSNTTPSVPKFPSSNLDFKLAQPHHPIGRASRQDQCAQNVAMARSGLIGMREGWKKEFGKYVYMIYIYMIYIYICI